MHLRQLPASLRHLCLLSLSALVASFGTVNEPLLLGQHNEHEMITRLAFQCPGPRSDGTCFERRSLDQLAGYHLDFLGFPIIGGGFNGAVGSPDTLDPVPEGPEAHCDDADFIDIPGYPQNRSTATAALQRCVDHLRLRFRQAVVSAEQLLDPSGAVRPDMVDLTHPVASGDCVFAFESLQNPESGRAKCNVVEGFGRALHGVQDFYAHSNWADKADPNQPISDLNPPGLGRTDRAPFIVDLAATGPIPSDQIPYNLSTGCFAIPDKTPGESDCAGRVTHHTLTKDYGIIHLNGSIGTPGPNAPRVEAVPENFQLAVEAAVKASRDLWANFRAELRKKYGPVKSDLMICSLVRDNSAEQCHNHALAIALDKSTASIERHADEVGLRISQSLTLNIGFTGADKVTVVDFDETTSVNAPWTGPPVIKHEVEQLHDPDSQPNIGGGLALGIDEVINAYPDSYTDKGAVVLLTSGFVRHDWTGDTLIQLQRAAAKGIRVHYGCINMPRLSDSEVLLGKEWLECSPGDAAIPAVLKTGGTFLFIDQDHPDSAAHYAALIMQHGLTAVDDTGEGEVTKIWPGITPAMILGPDHPSRRFSYTAGEGESVNFTVQDRFVDGQGAAGCYRLILTANTTSEPITRHIGCSDEERYSLPFTARMPMDLILTVEYEPNDQAGGEKEITHVDVVLTIEVQSDSDIQETPSEKDDSSSSVTRMTLTTSSRDDTERTSSQEADTFAVMTPVIENASKAVQGIRHSDL